MRMASAAGFFLFMATFVARTIIDVRQTPTPPEQKIETISLCELTKNWKKYDHRIVRVEAIYTTGPESSQVYDTGCLTSDTAWVPPEVRNATPADMFGKLNQLLGSTGRVRIVAVGEFDGPKKVDIPPGTSPGLAVTLQAANSHYGHQNGWDFQFVISKIEKVDPVPASEPWPHRAAEQKQ
jgi:hypothetical protein